MKKISIILAAIVTIAAIGCQKEIAEKPQDLVVVDSVMSADSVMIQYTAYGESDRALVFVHGWNCSQTHWVRQVDTFKDEFRVVTIDLAGHGKSGSNRTDWSVERWGDDVAAVVNALDLKEVALIGHSMGGPICIEAARRLPDRVVVLIGVDTYQNLGVMPPPELVNNLIQPFREDFESAADAFVRGMFLPTADSVLVNEVAQDLIDSDPELSVLWFESLFAYDAGAALEDMRKPIEAINGQMWETDVEGGRRVASSFDVIFMPDVGHFPHLEQPGIFNGHLRTVVRKFWPVEETT